MSITTYAELQTAIADTLRRTDMTDTITTFIDLAEADMQRRVRSYRMEARATLSLDAQYVDLPADWVETVRMRTTGSEGQAITLLDADSMANMRTANADTGGRPVHYSLSAGQLELFPSPDETYSADLLYIAKIPALADDNTSNWVLANFPDAYLYGALIHTAPYLMEDERLTTWAALHKAAIDAINGESFAAKHSGSGIKMKIRSY